MICLLLNYLSTLTIYSGKEVYFIIFQYSSIPVQYKKKYCKHVFDFINKNYLFPTLLI